MLKLTLLAMGNKMPTWVEQAVSEYTKRLQSYIQVNLIEIPLTLRTKTADLSKIMEKESQTMGALIPKHSLVISLDQHGEVFNSEQLAKKLEATQQHSSHLCFLIGGPEGLASDLKAKSNALWSLSPLTLPHPLARILLLESVYRAYSILNNHPYHK